MYEDKEFTNMHESTHRVLTILTKTIELEASKLTKMTCKFKSVFIFEEFNALESTWRVVVFHSL